jgi:S1-C subfamily serine protease
VAAPPTAAAESITAAAESIKDVLDPSSPLEPESAAAPRQPSQRQTEANEDPRPRKKAKTSRTKISRVALFLIFGGVSFSLLVVVASIFLCVQLWKNYARESSAVTTVRIGPRGFAPMFPMPAVPPNGQPNPDEDEDKDQAQKPAAVKDLRPLPPPRAPEFSSPPPKDAGAVVPSTGPANAELSPEVVQKVKQATVYLRVTLAEGSIAQGSGFFGVEPNIILTNAHVVGMLGMGSRPPKDIEVVHNSGEKDEKKFTAQVLAVDRRSDLAVLRVLTPGVMTAPAVPPSPPLEVKSARNLRETQQVWIVGFPFGARLGKEITVSHSSVSRLHKDNSGVLALVQVNGGMHPGNSGGPVVDAYGNVVGVAVSGMAHTQINFAVPGDYVHVILNGRIAGLTIGQPYLKEGVIRVAVTMPMIDPLERILQPAVEVWAGDPASVPRPPATSQPAQQPGDTPHQVQTLEYRNQVAQGEITLPGLPDGKVYWVQPVWRNRADGPQWATANIYPVPPPVEHRPVQLVYKHQVGSNRPLTLHSWLAMKLLDFRTGEHTLTATTAIRCNENTQVVGTEDVANVRLQYRAYNTDYQLDNRVIPNANLPRIRQDISTLAADLSIDKQGNLVGNQVDTKRVSQNSLTDLALIHEHVQQALEVSAVPLPNKLVAPGESWKAERSLPHPLAGQSDAGVLDLTYTYVGVRKRNGREEAVLALDGKVRNLKPEGARVEGRAHGTAVVDLAGGQVHQADLALILDLDLAQSAGLTIRADGTLDVRLERTLPAANSNN